VVVGALASLASVTSALVILVGALAADRRHRQQMRHSLDKSAVIR
jgi:hypothetical protein